MQEEDLEKRLVTVVLNKKINTLIEKRMDEIAKKEVKKSKIPYVECVAYPDNAQKQRLTGTRQLTQMTANSTNNMINSLASLEYWSLTKFGGNYKTNAVEESGDSTRPQSLDFDIQKLQAFVSLYNYDRIPVKVTCALIGIPNNNFYTGSSSGSSEISTVLRPNRS